MGLGGPYCTTCNVRASYVNKDYPVAHRIIILRKQLFRANYACPKCGSLDLEHSWSKDIPIFEGNNWKKIFEYDNLST